MDKPVIDVDVGDESRAVAACRAVGIPHDQTLRWLQTKDVRAKKSDKDDRARFDLEGPILPTGTMNYSDNPVGFTTPKMLREFLDEHKGEDIEINVNSPGGSVWDSTAMVSDLTRHDGDVMIVVSGAAFSAATDFLTIPGARRVAMQGSLFMVHNAFGFAVGSGDDLRKAAERLDKANDSYADRLTAVSTHSKEEWMKMMDDETWFSETEAKAAGLVDEVFGEEAAEDSKEESEPDPDVAPDQSVERGKMAVDSRLAILL